MDISLEALQARWIAFSVEAAFVLVLICVIILAWGWMLSSRFDHELKGFANGQALRLKLSTKTSYSLLLIVFALLLWALLAFSVVVAVDFVLFIGFIALYTGLKVLAVAGVILGVLSIWALLKGIIGKTPDSAGLIAGRKSQPSLWKLCDDIAFKVGTRPIDELRLHAGPETFVHARGGFASLLLGRQQRVLTLGLALASSLTIGEYEAVLAHEFGHFGNRDTSWATLTSSLGSTLHNAFLAMPKPGSGRWLVYWLLTFVNPTFWLLVLYSRLFFFVTSGFSRVGEVFADKVAVELAGSSNFESGLLKVGRASAVQAEYVRLLYEARDRGDYRQPPDVVDGMSRLSALVMQNKREVVDAMILDTAQSIYDSHPALKVRLDYAKRFDQPEHVNDSEQPASSIFAQWEELCRASTVEFLRAKA